MHPTHPQLTTGRSSCMPGAPAQHPTAPPGRQLSGLDSLSRSSIASCLRCQMRSRSSARSWYARRQVSRHASSTAPRKDSRLAWSAARSGGCQARYNWVLKDTWPRFSFTMSSLPTVMTIMASSPTSQMFFSPPTRNTAGSSASG
eukprot:scaffold16966_cov131-Isochrysis_galbana.AAC.3